MFFLGHNFSCRHARRSIKGSINATDCLVSNKNLIQKMAHWIGAQGPSKLVKNLKTCPLCDVTKRKPHAQIKQFFLIETRRLAASAEGLNSSLAIEAGELLIKLCQPIYRSARSSKCSVQPASKLSSVSFTF